MRKKFLHVALIVASMAVIFCVSAFAEAPYGYPDDLPPVPSDIEQYSYVVLQTSLRISVYYTDSSFVYDSGSLFFVPNVGSSVLGYSNYNQYQNAWMDLNNQDIPSSQTNLASGSILYSNFDLYDSNGELVYTVPVPPPPPPPDPYENFWSDLKEVGTGVLGWAGNVASTITAEPVLLFTVGIFILGAAIGIFRRLLVRG